MTQAEKPLTEADIHRSTPGHVYGVGAHSSGEKEPYTPDCSCPCHLADAPYPSNWYCDRCYAGIMRWTSAPDAPRLTYSHSDAKADGTANPQRQMRAVLDYYFVTKGNNLDDALGEHFPTEEEANARAAHLNAEDVIASLNLTPEAEKRVRAFREVAAGSAWWGYSEFWWAREQGRYAVWSYDGDGSHYWSTEDDLAAVEEEIERGEVERVVDLDAGTDIPFTRTVAVTLSPAE